MARQEDVTASDLGFYEWSGRTIERHRAEIRDLLGFRKCSISDYTAVTDWLVKHVTQVERQVEQVRSCWVWLRRQTLEPPGRLLIDRICAGLIPRFVAG